MMFLKIILLYFIPAKFSEDISIHLVVTDRFTNFELSENESRNIYNTINQKFFSLLDYVVKQIQIDSNKKFSIGSVVLFKYWFEKLSNKERQNVLKYFENSQLSFSNGGQFINDESITDYLNIIEQMSAGLRYITYTFKGKYRPKAAWQTGFGHSLGQAAILNAMRIKLAILSKVSYDKFKLMYQNKAIEFYWKIPKIEAGQTFYHRTILANQYNYKHIPNCENIDNLQNSFFKTDKASDIDYRLQLIDCYKDSIVNSGFSNLLIVVNIDTTAPTMIDKYEYIDQLISKVNQNPNTKMFYSNFDNYYQAILKETQAVKSYAGDFLPFVSAENEAWNGYYALRSWFKRMTRSKTEYARVCKQFLAFESSEDSAKVKPLQSVIDIAQHYVLATGAANDAIYKWFLEYFEYGTNNCTEVINSVFKKFLVTNSSITHCEDLEIDRCPMTDLSTYYVIVYNPTPQIMHYDIFLPASDIFYHIIDSDMVLRKVYATPKLKIPFLDSIGNVKTNIISFNVKIKPLEARVYRIGKIVNSEEFFPISAPILHGKYFIFENQYYIAKFNVYTRDFASIGLKNGPTIKYISVSLQFLTSKTQSNNNTADELIFIPPPGKENQCFSSDYSRPCSVHGSSKNDIFRIICDETLSCQFEIHFNTNSRAIRIRYAVEFSEKGFTTDVYMKWNTNISSGNVFYTDINGRSVKQRHVQSSGNIMIASLFYPVVKRIFINDSSVQLNIFTDRSLGGTSLMPGNMQLMIHRLVGGKESGSQQEFNYNDMFRIKEENIVGNVWMMISDNKNENIVAETMYNLQHPPFVSLSADSKAKRLVFLKRDEYLLPPCIRLLSFERYELNKKYTHLIRLENIYSPDIKSECQNSCDLAKFFNPYKVITVQETILSGDMLIKDSKDNINCEAKKCGPSLSVNVEPMQIRTFLIKLEK